MQWSDKGFLKCPSTKISGMDIVRVFMYVRKHSLPRTHLENIERKMWGKYIDIYIIQI